MTFLTFLQPSGAAFTAIIQTCTTSFKYNHCITSFYFNPYWGLNIKNIAIYPTITFNILQLLKTVRVTASSLQSA